MAHGGTRTRTNGSRYMHPGLAGASGFEHTTGVTEPTRIRENLEGVRAAIADAATKAGGHAVRLVAVTKGQPAEAVLAAFEAGQTDFGENYIQELAEKREAIGELPGLRFHVIGPLQRNKVRDALRWSELIQTVDRADLAVEIDKRARKPVDVLVQVNVGREPQKTGVLLEDAPELVERVAALPNLRLQGLMTVPPLEQDATQNRPMFAALRVLKERLIARGLGPLPELSMGMSHDFTEAILEGATMVRVGTAIFGARTRKA